MADNGSRPAVAGVLLLLLLSACASSGSIAAVTSSASPSARPLVIHWMSFQHHAEPRYQLLYEGGSVGEFTQLRLIGSDGAAIASGLATPTADAVLQMCTGSKSGQPPPPFGAIRVTLSLASQVQFGAVLRDPDRYRVEVLAHETWTLVTLVHNCDAQE